MLKVWGVPAQVNQNGVTVIVATTFVFVLFTGVKEGIIPFAEAPSPMLVLLLVHENVTPDDGLLTKEMEG